MEIDRRAFFAGLGGVAAVAAMADEAKAEALEHHMMLQLNVANQTSPAAKFPTAAEVEAEIETRPTRRGTGNLFVSRAGNVKRLPPLPEEKVVEEFGKPGLVVIQEKGELNNWLMERSYKNANLLLMSSGNYDGLDLTALSAQIIQESL